MEKMDTETGEMIVKRVSVPIGLEELMEGLVKEVLLKKPDDIYLFAARYFANLLTIRDRLPINRTKTVRTIQTMKVRTDKTPALAKNSRLSKPLSTKEELPVITPITSHKPKMHQRNELKYNRRRHTGPQTVIPNAQQVAIRRKYAKSVSGDQQKVIMETNNNKNKAQILREKLTEKSATERNNNLAKSSIQNTEDTKEENSKIIEKQVDPIKKFVDESTKLVASENIDTSHINPENFKREKNSQSSTNNLEQSGLNDATKAITVETNSNTSKSKIDEIVDQNTVNIDNKKEEHSNAESKPESNNKLDMDDNKEENITDEELHTVKPDFTSNEKHEMSNNEDKGDKSNKIIQKSENSLKEIISRSSSAVQLDDENKKHEEIVPQISTSDKIEQKKENDLSKNQISTKHDVTDEKEEKIEVKNEELNKNITKEQKENNLAITEDNELMSKNKNGQYQDNDKHSEYTNVIPFNKTVDDEVISKVLLYNVPDLKNGEPAKIVELNVLKSISNSKEEEPKIKEITNLLDKKETTDYKTYEENPKQDEKEFSEDSLEFIEEKKIEGKKINNKENDGKNENFKGTSNELEIGETTTEEPILKRIVEENNLKEDYEKSNLQAADTSIDKTEIINIINPNVQVDVNEIKSNEEITDVNKLDKEQSSQNIDIIEEKNIKPPKLNEKELNKQASTETSPRNVETLNKNEAKEDEKDRKVTVDSILDQKSVDNKTYHDIDSNKENSDQAPFLKDSVEQITKTNSEDSATNNAPIEKSLEETKIVNSLVLETTPDFDGTKQEVEVNTDKSNDIKSTEKNNRITDDVKINNEAGEVSEITKQDNVQIESAKIIAGNNAEFANIDGKEKQLLTDDKQSNNVRMADEIIMRTEKNVDLTSKATTKVTNTDESIDTAEVKNNKNETNIAQESNANKSKIDKIYKESDSNDMIRNVNLSNNKSEGANEHLKNISKIEETTRNVPESDSSKSEVNVDVNKKSSQTNNTQGSTKDSVTNLKPVENKEENKTEISTIKSDDIIKKESEISDEHNVEVNKIIEKNNSSEENKIEERVKESTKSKSETSTSKLNEIIENQKNIEENLINEEKRINDENTIKDEKTINQQNTIKKEKTINQEDVIKEEKTIKDEKTINEENKVTYEKVDALTNVEKTGETFKMKSNSKDDLTNSTHTEENKDTETNLLQKEENKQNRNDDSSIKGDELFTKDYKSNASNLTTTNTLSSKEDILDTANHKENNEREVSIEIANSSDDNKNIKKENLLVTNAKDIPSEEESQILIKNSENSGEEANKHSEENEAIISDEQDKATDTSKRLKRAVSFEEEDSSNLAELDKQEADNNLVDRVAKNYVSYVIDKDRYVTNDRESLEKVDVNVTNQGISSSNEYNENRETQRNNENTEEKTEIGSNLTRNSELHEDKKELIITAAEQLVSSTLLMAETGLIEHKVKNFLNDFISREQNNTSTVDNANQHHKLLTKTNSLDDITTKPPNGVKRTISFDSAKLHQELRKVEEESKLASFKTTFNPFLLRKEIEEASKSENTVVLTSLNFAQISNATVKIQRVWRKFRKMKQLKYKSEENGRSSDKGENLKCDSGVNKDLSTTVRAALLIQKMWKGFRARKELRLMKIEAHLKKNTSSKLEGKLENPELFTKDGADENSSELTNNHKFTEDGEDKIASEDRRLFSADSTGSTNTVIFNSNSSKEEQFHNDVGLLLDEQIDYPTVEEEHLLDNYQSKLLDKISGKEDCSKFDIQAYEKIVSPKRIDLEQLKEEVHVPIVPKTAPKLNRSLSSKLEILEEETSNAEEDNEDNQDNKITEKSDKIGDEKLNTICPDPTLVSHDKIADEETVPDNTSKSPSKLTNLENLQIQETPLASLPIELKDKLETENKPEESSIKTDLGDSPPVLSNASIDNMNIQDCASNHPHEVQETLITPIEQQNEPEPGFKPEDTSSKTNLDDLPPNLSNANSDNKHLQDSVSNPHNAVQETLVTKLSTEKQNKPETGIKPEENSTKTNLVDIPPVLSDVSSENKDLQDSTRNHPDNVQETLITPLSIEPQNKQEAGFKPEEASNKIDVDNVSPVLSNSNIDNKNLQDSASNHPREVQETISTPIETQNKRETGFKPEETSNQTNLDDLPPVLSNANSDNKHHQDSVSNHYNGVEKTLITPLSTDQQNKPKTEFTPEENSNKTNLDDLPPHLLNANTDDKNLQDSVSNHHSGSQETLITPLSIDQQNKPETEFKPEETNSKTDLDDIPPVHSNASGDNKNLQDTTGNHHDEVQETPITTLSIEQPNTPETGFKQEDTSNKSNLVDLPPVLSNTSSSSTISASNHHSTSALPLVLQNQETEGKSEEVSSKTTIEDLTSISKIVNKNLQDGTSKQHHEVQETLVIPIPIELQNKLKTETKIGGINEKTSLEDISSVLSSSGMDIKNLHDTVALPLNEQQVDTGRVQPISVQLCETSEPENLMTPRRSSTDVTDAGDAAGTPAPGKAALREEAPAPDRLASDSTTRNMESEKRRKVDGAKMEAQAAAKIQAGFRGYQVRKQLKLKNGSSDMTPAKKSSRSKLSGQDSSKCPSENCEDIEEQSAVKIQAGIRGFLVRRRQKKLNSQHT
ncbi:unnamed protein product [Phyllotreta striolata]|uniref:RIIa domain-containing protein n=1 Tax=Phyllotreta striolata TaxID=444603 RepID=A0A9P0DXB3_PHYSR|nr:unnamed protein product [Phyllotreta striolata]